MEAWWFKFQCALLFFFQDLQPFKISFRATKVPDMEIMTAIPVTWSGNSYYLFFS